MYHKDQETGNHLNFPVGDENHQLLKKYAVWNINPATEIYCLMIITVHSVLVHIKIYFPFPHFSYLSTVNIIDMIPGVNKREKQACETE